MGVTPGEAVQLIEREGLGTIAYRMDQRDRMHMAARQRCTDDR